MIQHSLAPEAYCKWTEISLAHLQHNLELIRSHAPQSEIMGVVKANAYGHNVSIVAPALYQWGVRYFGVATLEEALYLRKWIPEDCPILVLGALSPHQIQRAIAHGFEFMVYSQSSLEAALEWAKTLSKQAKVHLKIDSGMGRVGILPQELSSVDLSLLSSPEISWMGVCSHLATSDQLEPPFVQEQLAAFDRCLELLSPPKQVKIHVANSDAIFQWPQAHYDIVRPGISLYGYCGLPEIPLKPVLSLKAQLTQVKTLPPQHSIGYGRLYTTATEERVGIVPVGYADGLNRSLTGLKVKIQGQETRLLGRISMDQCVVDLSHLPEVESEAVVSFIDESLTASDWAKRLNTIHYEVLTGLGARLPRFKLSPSG